VLCILPPASLSHLVSFSQACHHFLDGTPYDEELVPQWVNSICETVLGGLCRLGKPYKFVGTKRLQRLFLLPFLLFSHPSHCPPPVHGRTAPVVPHCCCSSHLVLSSGSPVPLLLPCYLSSSVSAVIMQRTGAALHSSTSFFWDPLSDGMCAPPCSLSCGRLSGRLSPSPVSSAADLPGCEHRFFVAPCFPVFPCSLVASWSCFCSLPSCSN